MFRSIFLLQFDCFIELFRGLNTSTSEMNTGEHNQKCGGLLSKCPQLFLFCECAIGADILHGGDGKEGPPPSLAQASTVKAGFPSLSRRRGAVRHIIVMVAAGGGAVDAAGVVLAGCVLGIVDRSNCFKHNIWAICSYPLSGHENFVE